MKKTRIISYVILAFLCLALIPALGYAAKLIDNKVGGSVAVVGDLPSGYTQLQYIESTGTQYINTGVIPTKNTGFEVVFECNSTFAASSYATIFGAQTSSQNNGYSLTTSSQSSNSGTFFWGTTNYNAGINVGNKITCSLSNFSYLDASLNAVAFSSSQNVNPNCAITIFALNKAGTISGYSLVKLYDFKIYDGNILIRHLIPCRNSNAVAGLYDVVNDIFYTNAGSGDFTAA